MNTATFTVTGSGRKSMTEKRKRPEAAAEACGKEKRVVKKGEEDNGEIKTVTDDEVEEFYAILRRIHVAVKYFQKVNGEDRESKKLKTSFESQEFGGNKGVMGEDEEEEEEGVMKNLGLDLNVDPVTEGKTNSVYEDFHF